MKNILFNLTLLITGLVVGVVVGKGMKKTYTVTNLDDELLVDIGNQDIISHESVKVYVNDKLA